MPIKRAITGCSFHNGSNSRDSMPLWYREKRKRLQKTAAARCYEKCKIFAPLSASAQFGLRPHILSRLGYANRTSSFALLSASAYIYGMKSKRIPPMAWIPTLYVAEGLPYVAVNTLSVIMYKNMGMSNTDIAFYTGWLYLPWVIKPFWSPFVDIIRTKRWWTVTTQFIIGAAFAAIALTLPLDSYVAMSLAVFWLIGFASATHDIAADGYYMLALDSSDQSLYVGIRSAFYRLATIIGQGGVVMAAGWMETAFGNVPRAWAVTFLILSALFFAVAVYHSRILPRPTADRPSGAVSETPEIEGKNACSAWGPNQEPHSAVAST